MLEIKPIYKKVLQWVVMLAAYGYLIYKLCTYSEYDSWFAYFRSANGDVYTWLLLAVLLVPINILLEAAKWRSLIAGIEKISMLEAVLQVCYGQLTAFVTPYRIGDYPGRIMRIHDQEKWPALLGAGVIGSGLITAVIIACGLPAAFSKLLFTETGATILYLVVMVGLLFLLPYLTKKISRKNMLMGLGFSVLRYIVWLVQLGMILYFVGIELDFRTLLVSLATYYLFVTITPSMPAADMAVRGSWLLVVLSDYTDQTAAIAMAAITMWLINTVLPMLAGTMVRK